MGFLGARLCPATLIKKKKKILKRYPVFIKVLQQVPLGNYPVSLGENRDSVRALRSGLVTGEGRM